MLSNLSPVSVFAPPGSRTLRVLDVTKFYAPTGGGVRTYLEAKISHFKTRQVHHVLVIPGPRSRRGRRGNTTVYRIPGVRIPFTPGYRLLLSAQALRGIIHSERPDVMEVGSPFLVPLVARWAAKGWSIPTVGFYHADLVRTYVDPYVGRLHPLLQRRLRRSASEFVRTVYSQFDATVAASSSVAQELRELGIPNVRTVPLGVDLDLFRPEHRSTALRESLDTPPGVPIALFAGRLCPEKGLGVIVEAHGRMAPSRRPHLLFVGEGPSTPSLVGIARDRTDMTVLPFISDKRVLARVYASADLYLAAGPGETFGLSVAEAMASGTPVVAVSSGAAPDRVMGSGAGELYERNDPDSAAEAMGRMTSRLGAGIREAARAHAERTFGWDRTFETLLDLYGDLAGERRQS